MQSALRTFFRFCLHDGYIQQPLDRAVATLRNYKLATVPRGLTDIQAQQVLRCMTERISQMDQFALIDFHSLRVFRTMLTRLGRGVSLLIVAVVLVTAVS